MSSMKSSGSGPHIFSSKENKSSRSALNILRAAVGSTLRLIPSVIKKRGLFSVRACLRFVSVLGNLSGHRALLDVITHPHIVELMRRHPRLGYRYLAPYMARSFDKNARLDVMTNHYRYLSDHVGPEVLARIYEESPVIWEERIDNQLFGITLSFPEENDYEGDLRLSFQMDSVSLYSIVLTIAPGRALNMPNEQVLLISAVQGAAGKIDLIRQVTKTCHGSAPVYLLLAAAEAIALSLAIDTIAGMSSGQQIARANKTGAHGFFDYDGFWMDFIGTTAIEDFYATSVPFPEKPLIDLKSNRRSRALRRRSLKNQISRQAQAWLTKNFLKAAKKRA